MNVSHHRIVRAVGVRVHVALGYLLSLSQHICFELLEDVPRERVPSATLSFQLFHR